MEKQIDLRKTGNKLEVNTLLKNVTSRIQSSCIIVDCGITDKGKYVVCAFANENEECIFELFKNVEEMNLRVHLSLLTMFKNISCESVIVDCSIGSLPNVISLFKAIGIRQIFPQPLQRTIKITDESQLVRLDKGQRKVKALTSAF